MWLGIVSRLYLEDEEVFSVDVDAQLFKLLQVGGGADNLSETKMNQQLISNTHC